MGGCASKDSDEASMEQRHQALARDTHAVERGVADAMLMHMLAANSMAPPPLPGTSGVERRRHTPSANTLATECANGRRATDHPDSSGDIAAAEIEDAPSPKLSARGDAEPGVLVSLCLPPDDDECPPAALSQTHISAAGTWSSLPDRETPVTGSGSGSGSGSRSTSVYDSANCSFHVSSATSLWTAGSAPASPGAGSPLMHGGEPIAWPRLLSLNPLEQPNAA